MFDTHAHLNFNAFKKDYSEVMKRSFDNGIEGIINIGTRFDNSEIAIEIAEKFSDVYAAIGFHPDHLDEIKTENIDSEIEKFRKLVENPKVVAIGEIGLDNYYFKSGKLVDTKENHKKAEEIFKKMLNLAQEVNLPVIIHSREAEAETLEILQHTRLRPGATDGQAKNPSTTLGAGKTQNLRGVVHCFSGSMGFAKKILELGFYIGFTGIVTYPPRRPPGSLGQAKTDELSGVVKEIPLEKILVETDCPFLAPQKYRGKRCEPWYVSETAKKIAEIKGISEEKIAKITTQNAKELFGFI